jgi:aspartyl aminopeptidase
MAAQHALQGKIDQPSAGSDEPQNDEPQSDETCAPPPPPAPRGEWIQAQEPLLLSVIAEELNVPINAIADFELSLYDTQAS